jgi:hypothetical protein
MSRPENDESDTPRDESGAVTIQLGRIGQNQGRIRRESRSSAIPSSPHAPKREASKDSPVNGTSSTVFRPMSDS